MTDPRTKLTTRPGGLQAVPGAQPRTFHRNSFVFYSECAADAGYFIRCGHVRCFLLDANGRETTTAILGPGHFVGKAALLGMPMHKEFCEALTDVDAWSVPVDELCRGCADSPLIAGWLLGSIGRQLELALALRRGISLLSARDCARDIHVRLQTLSGIDSRVVRQTSLASLLQIRPETLARTRRLTARPLREGPCDQESLRHGRHEFTAEHRVLNGHLPDGCVGQVLIGSVELSLTASPSRAVLVEKLGPGDLFGVSSLLGMPALSYSLKGEPHSAVSVLTSEELLRVVAASPAACGHMVTRTAQRLQSLEQQLARAAVPQMADRLVHLLREVATDDCVPASWSHDALARRLGVSRETVTRRVAALVKAGVIARQGRRMVIVADRTHQPEDSVPPRQTNGVARAPRANKCGLCGLRTAGTLCTGCEDRLELELERNPRRACSSCGRHRELCQIIPCTTSSQTASKSKGLNSSIVWLAVATIDEPDAERNSRRRYIDHSIAELATSLRQEGFLQPVCVRRKGARFELVFGVRRFRAAVQAGLTEVPCIVREADDDRALLLNTLENLHREQLSNVERVNAIERLAASGHGVREIGRRTGFNASTISRWLRVNRRPELKQAVEENRIDIARAVILVDAPAPLDNSLIERAMAVSTAELRRQVYALKSSSKSALQTDRRHVTDALRCLRAVREHIEEPLLLEMLRMEVSRICGNAPAGQPEGKSNGTAT